MPLHFATTAPPVTRLLGLATAVPPHHGSQEDASRFMARVIEAAPPCRERDLARRLVDRIYRTSGIERRHSYLLDFLAETPADFKFFPPSWELEPFPGTAARMQLYARHAVGLAEEAARAALAEAGVAPSAVTHLVLSTCTGFFAPGPEIHLIRQLGLRPTVRRTLLGFMGCHAGLIGVDVADRIVRAEAGAVVLQIAIELCSIHFQKGLSPDALLSNCLFSDGCAAAVYAAGGDAQPALAVIRGTRSLLGDDSLDQMAWDIGDHGFLMRLSTAVPETLRREAPAFVDAMLDCAGLARADVAGWALHPGGRRVVEALGEALALDDGPLAPSFGVLRDYGNMSSATIFFVLDRVLRAGGGGPVAALAFGPGLTVEGAVFDCAAERD